MLAHISCLYLILYLCISSSQPGHIKKELTAKEIVEAYIKAIGGIDEIKAVKGKRVTYHVHMFGNEAFLMERSWTRPNSMKSGRPEATIYILTEGEKTWRVTPEGRRELPPLIAQSLSKQADIDGPLIDHEQKGVTLLYSGTVQYDMVDLHQITATFPDGIQWEFYFDAVSGLLRRMTQPSFYMQNDQINRGDDAHYFYYDYRVVGGVLYPHLWIQSTDNHTHLFVVEEIEISK